MGGKACRRALLARPGRMLPAGTILLACFAALVELRSVTIHRQRDEDCVEAS